MEKLYYGNSWRILQETRNCVWNYEKLFVWFYWSFIRDFVILKGFEIMLEIFESFGNNWI